MYTKKLTIFKTVSVTIVSLFILVALLRFINPPITSLILIRTLQYRLSGQHVVKRWEWLSVEKIPIPAKRAIIAAEDSRFMEHWGVDFAATVRAIKDSNARKRMRGASTITMQTIKNLFLWPGRSYLRKIIEVITSPVIEILWGKKRILELYLNIVEWGNGIYGIEAASKYYFHHSASKLTSYEAAILAAMLPSPRALSPNRLSPLALKRLRRVMGEMRGVRVPG